MPEKKIPQELPQDAPQEIALVVAYAHGNVIGCGGRIPWNIPGEQQRFKNLTDGNVVIMGRRTFEEILTKLKKPLPGRINLIVSSAKDFSAEGCPTFLSLEQALKYAAVHFPQKKVFVCGGAQLYKEAIPLVHKMYITEIDIDVPGDTFFPLFNTEKFDIIEEYVSDGDVKYRCLTYTKKQCAET